MNLGTLAGLLRARAELRSHDRWSRDELLRHQAGALAELRRFAVSRSPFYRDLHLGLDEAPLEALPVVTKQTVMERFDDIVTDREVRLADIEVFLARPDARATDTFRDRYRVTTTGGTTGRRGVFLSDPTEWQTILASYSRANDWAGIAAGLTSRLRMAVVSSRNPSHQSAMVGATVASRFVPTLRLDAAQPIGEIVGQLNAFQPGALVGYASALRLLADEQLDGRLAIRPHGVFSASEVLTAETRARLGSAFGVEPTNVYAATETAGIASECRRGRLHRYEDLVIAEIVGNDNRPVEHGATGTKVLVTVLFSRTQPLIRYEMSDRVQALGGGCPDGLPYAVIGGIEGREEEVLTLAGVAVHPNLFHGVLERLDLAGWQVIETDGRLRVLLARPNAGLNVADLNATIRSALERVGVRGIAIECEVVDAIPRTVMGKAPLIRRESPPAHAASVG
jgi:phenylacetate-CoA ligase